MSGAGADNTVFTANPLGNEAGTEQMIQLQGNVAGTHISGIGFECTVDDPSYNDAAMIFIAGNGAEGQEVIIENCSFTGKPSEKNGAAAISAAYNCGSYVIVRNNVVNNVKHAMYFNTFNNSSIISNDITGVTSKGITVASGDGNFTIQDNILSGVSGIGGYGIEIKEGVNTDNVVITNNEINTANILTRPISGFDQVAHVAVTDADGTQHNHYFSTLTEAVESEKTAENSTITLHAQPSEEDASVLINKNITVDANEFAYKPNVDDELATVTDNGDGTFSITVTPKAPDEPEPGPTPEPEPTPDPEPTPEPAPEPSHSSGGGGCSAGFGALALLAAVPLMFRRKK